MRKKSDTNLGKNKEDLESRIVMDLFVYDTLIRKRLI